MSSPGMLIRNVVIAGAPRRTLLVQHGRVTELRGEVSGDIPVIDGDGGILMPGLVDHHIHLLAAAAAANSFDFGPIADDDTVSIEETIRRLTPNGPVRVIGYSGDRRPLLSRWDLDRLSGSVPIRVQYRTGGLWVLNGAALESILAAGAAVPAEFERDAHGRLTGRVWRGDHHLRNGLSAIVPLLERLGADLARWGVTGVTDASATTTQDQAAVIARAATGFPQRLCLMSGTPLSAKGARFSVGPLKLMLDDHDLPDLDAVIGAIRSARAQNRCVAAHCVTTGELAFMIAAFSSAGAMPGDRIEHGSLIPADMMPALADLGLTVVTQPAFVFARGDRYLRSVPPAQRRDLYRLKSLLDMGVRVAAGSDAPFGPANPWIAIRAAADRRTRLGVVLNESERVDPESAIALYRPGLLTPDEPRRAIYAGMIADLCLLRSGASPIDEDPVAMTVIGGEIAYLRGGAAKSGNLCLQNCAPAH